MTKSSIMVEPLNKVTDLFLGNGDGSRTFYAMGGKNGTSIIIADDLFPEPLEKGAMFDVVDTNGNSFGQDYLQMEVLDVITKETTLINRYNLENFDGLYKVNMN